MVDPLAVMMLLVVGCDVEESGLVESDADELFTGGRALPPRLALRVVSTVSAKCITHRSPRAYQKRLAVCQMPVNVKGIIATYCADQRKVCQEKLCQCMKGKRYSQWSAVADKKQKVQVCPRTMAVTVCQTVSVCVSLKLRLVPRLTLGGSEKRIDG